MSQSTRQPLTDAQLRALAVAVSGTVTVSNPTTSPETGLSKEVTLGRRFGGSKLSDGGNYTATTDITPTAGMAMRLLWVAFVPNSDNTAANLIDVRFVGAAKPLYVGYAMAHWERFDGALNTALRITLSNSQPVAVTVHFEEYTP